MAKFDQCISLLQAGVQKFKTPSAKLVRTSLKADSITSGNIFRIPIEGGRLGDTLKKVSNDGKLIAEVERKATRKVSNLTLYEYAQSTNLMRKTHSFGSPDTTFTDVMRVTEDGEILSNIDVNRSSKYVQKIMDRYFGVSEPEWIKTWESVSTNADGTRVGVASCARNPLAVPEQNNKIETVLKIFGLTRKDLA